MPREDRARLGEVALQRDWPDLATDAANAGAAWDRLDLRFPMTYWERFQAASQALGIDAFDLIASPAGRVAYTPWRDRKSVQGG